MKTSTIGWLNKCRCGNKSHTVKTARGNETALWDDDTVKCNSCGRGGVIQVCEGQARVLWETDEEMAENKSISTITIDPRDAFEKAFPMPKHVIRCGNGYACTEYNAWGAHDFIRQWEGWSAAMLQGAKKAESRCSIQTAPALDSSPKIAESPTGINQGKSEPVTTAYKLLEPIKDHRLNSGPDADDYYSGYQEGWNEALEAESGNSPVIADGWVACSERMPEENAEQEVLACFKGGDISTLYYFEGRWDDAYGIVPIRQDVTHWMPLPAAPQQEV